MGREMSTWEGDGLPRAMSSARPLALTSATSALSASMAASSSVVSIFW